MDKLEHGHAAWPSRGQRHAVDLEATVSRERGDYSSLVTNLSLDGCCLTGHFRIGEHLTVRVARLGEFPAQIRWALPGMAGARFIPRDPQPEGTLAEDQTGVAAIEYALVAGLIALAIVAALTRTGTAAGSNWNEVNQAMPGGVQFQTP